VLLSFLIFLTGAGDACVTEAEGGKDEVLVAAAVAVVVVDEEVDGPDDMVAAGRFNGFLPFDIVTGEDWAFSF
jgi:hypothetical protein